MKCFFPGLRDHMAPLLREEYKHEVAPDDYGVQKFTLGFS